MRIGPADRNLNIHLWRHMFAFLGNVWLQFLAIAIKLFDLDFDWFLVRDRTTESIPLFSWCDLCCIRQVRDKWTVSLAYILITWLSGCGVLLLTFTYMNDYMHAAWIPCTKDIDTMPDYIAENIWTHGSEPVKATTPVLCSCTSNRHNQKNARLDHVLRTKKVPFTIIPTTYDTLVSYFDCKNSCSKYADFTSYALTFGLSHYPFGKPGVFNCHKV